MDAIEREADRQIQVIRQRASEIVPEVGLRRKLTHAIREGRPLRIKYGIDPTSPHVHIGHFVPCRIIRAFQDLGHLAVLIIGDYTARVGDPTGRSKERTALSAADVEENMKEYSKQLFTIVDSTAVEVRYQSEWFEDLSMTGILGLQANFSVAQMLAHDTFRSRIQQGERLSLHEMMYPLMQAYDSVMVRADVEIGGTDQKFNCLCGRDLQRSLDQQPQVVVTAPLLMGTDGQKMSKSLDNHISVNLSAVDIVGRVMSIPDSLLPDYIALTTDWDHQQRTQETDGLSSGALHPRDVKLRVARSVAIQLCGETAADAAVEHFQRVVAQGALPREIPEITVECGATSVVDLVVLSGLVTSRSEARRLIAQRGVRIDDQMVESIQAETVMEPGKQRVLRVGKRRFVRLVCRGSAPAVQVLESIHQRDVNLRD